MMTDHIPYCIRCSQGQRVLMQKRVNDGHWVCPNLDCDFELDEDMVVVNKWTSPDEVDETALQKYVGG